MHTFTLKLAAVVGVFAVESFHYCLRIKLTTDAFLNQRVLCDTLSTNFYEAV